MFESNRTVLEYGDDVVSEIADRCKEVETGARNIDQVIAQHIMPNISNEIISALSKGIKPKQLVLGYKDDNFTFEIDGEQ